MAEAFWNEVNFTHLLLLKDLGVVHADIKLIADYKETRCPKNKDDPYCFGTKEGKTVHKTLVFSILSGELHQVVFAYKIAKQQHKLPLFAESVRRLKAAGFTINYGMLDRGFYRKELLVAFKRWGITVIMPGRQCTETKTMIVDYLNGKKIRHGIGHMKLGYVRKQGNVYLQFGILLCAKRSWNLGQIKADYAKGNLSLNDAAARIFPLIVLIANSRGITKIQGNENRIRMIYRLRWNIEIAFREMNRFGLAPRSQHRDGRLSATGARILVYNMWQVERHQLGRADPTAPALELNEFLGRGCIPRRVQCVKIVGEP
ncbi:MAG: transposase [Candidatus Lokiarchaeota archaeon]|nr:transposase [Candidatus Lokiarchaeota archaeon]